MNVLSIMAVAVRELDEEGGSVGPFPPRCVCAKSCGSFFWDELTPPPPTGTALPQCTRLPPPPGKATGSQGSVQSLSSAAALSVTAATVTTAVT